MTTSFGTAKAAIAMDPNFQITASFNGLRSASNSLLLARRPQVFLPSSGGTASFIRAVSTLDCLLVLLGVSSTEVKWSIEGGGKCTNRTAENPLAEKTTCYVRIELHEKFQTASQLLIPDACLVLLDVAIHSWRLSYDINKEQNKIFLD